MALRWHVFYIALLLLSVGWLMLKTAEQPGSQERQQVSVLCKLGWPPTKREVVKRLGHPRRIYPAGSELQADDARPVPPPANGAEVWMYARFAKLTFVYFDRTGRVYMVFYATT